MTETKKERLEKKLERLTSKKSDLIVIGREYNGYNGFMRAIGEEPIAGKGKKSLVDVIEKFLEIEKKQGYIWKITGYKPTAQKENKRKISNMQYFILAELAKIVSESKEYKIIGTKTNLLKKIGLIDYSFHITNEREEERRATEMKFFFKATDLKMYTIYGQYLDLLWKTFYVPLNSAISTSKRNNESDKYFPFSVCETIAIYYEDGTSKESDADDEELIRKAVESHPEIMQAYSHKYYGKDFWEFQSISKKALNEENIKLVLPSVVLQMNHDDKKEKDYEGLVPFWADSELSKEKARNMLITNMLKEYLETEPEEKDLGIFLTFLIIDHFKPYKKKEELFAIMSRAKLCSHSIIESRPSTYKKNFEYQKKFCPKPKTKF